uniref:Uncharacterized protein n=1 Tax=Heterorhabditis bacteriophora TaxID=37862 RepID=A0A1I7WFK8_HETBA
MKCIRQDQATIGPSGGVGMEVKQNTDSTEVEVDSLCVNSHNVEELRRIRYPAQQQPDRMWRLRYTARSE